MAKPLQTLALLGTLRTLLFVFNVFLWVIGFLLIPCGIWIAYRLTKYLEFNAGSYSYINSSAILMVFGGFGGTMLVIASAACHCTVKGSAIKIYIYSAFLVLLLAGEMLFVGFGFFSRAKLDDAFHEGLSRGLEQYGKDTSRTAAIDDIQTTLECCGVSNYSDWQVTPWGRGHGGNKLPHSCCSWTPDAVCGGTDIASRWPMLHETGCYLKIMGFLVENFKVIVFGVVLVGFIQVVGITIACYLARRVRMSEYEEVQQQNGGGHEKEALHNTPKVATSYQYPVSEDEPASLKQTIQMTRQNLKPVKKDKSSKKSKAQSIDWTTQLVKPEYQSGDETYMNHHSDSHHQHHLTSVQINHHQQLQEPTENYYSVPRKCTQRAMSSNYLDQPLLSQGQGFHDHSNSWSSTVPRPPPSPPPSPPYANRSVWAGSERKRGGAKSDSVHNVAAYRG